MTHYARFLESTQGTFTCQLHRLLDDGGVAEPTLAEGTGPTRQDALSAAYRTVKDERVRAELRQGILDDSSANLR